MSYPISSQVRSYKPETGGYEEIDHALIPHGLSVIVNAPAVFRFTAMANPERHAICAEIFSNARRKRESLPYDECVPATSRYSRESADYAGEWLVEEIRVLCRDLNIPMGLQSFGYSEDDIPDLVEGTVQQHRVTKISHRPVGKAELEQLFLESMVSQEDEST